MAKGRIARRLSLETYRAPLPLQEWHDYDEYWVDRGQGQETGVWPRWELAVAKIEDGATVLDVGCGPGGFLQYLMERRPNCKAIGTDISLGAVEATQKAGFEAFQTDLAVTPLDRRFDYITAFEVIEHIHEAERVLCNLRDATDRQLIMSLPNIGYIEHRVRLGLFGRFPNTTLIFHQKEHIRHWTVTDFRTWADHFDLDVVDVQGQKGFPLLPWKRWPSLFAPQVVYTLQPNG